MNTKPAARFAFRWMMAVETGDPSWHTMDAAIVNEAMWRDFGHDDFAEILSQCRQWVPTLFNENGEPVDWEDFDQAQMGKSGTVGRLHRRVPCRRCGGAGGWSGWRIDGGRCFRCHGRDSKIFDVSKTKVWTKAGLARLERSRARANAKAEAEAAKRRQEREERIQALVAEHPHLQALLDTEHRDGSFLASLQSQLRTKGTLSERQVEAAAEALERIQERKAEAAASEHLGSVGERLRDLPARVVFVKDLESQYGPKRLVKLVVRGHHQVVTFSTSAWVWEVEKGDEVLLTGTVKDHDAYQGAKQTVLTRTSTEWNR